MTYTVIIFAIAFAGLTALMLLKFRIRLDITDKKRTMFVGLGRTGTEFSLRDRTLWMKVFGYRLKQMKLGGKKIEKKMEKEKPGKEARPRPKVRRRLRSRVDFLKIGRRSASALFSFSKSLVKATYIERLDGNINAGFDSPDLTGKLYGFYQASLSAAPSLMGRLSYQPDWSGASFRGSAHLSLALPMYKFCYESIRLIFSLPLRDIIRLAIGTKKGGHDV